MIVFADDHDDDSADPTESDTLERANLREPPSEELGPAPNNLDTNKKGSRTVEELVAKSRGALTTADKLTPSSTRRASR